MEIADKVRALRNSEVRETVEKRLSEFEKKNSMASKEWFSELCFCILTANSKAETAIKIQEEIGAEGFCSYTCDSIRDVIFSNKHRFHNNKSRFIFCAREYADIKPKIKSLVKESGIQGAREWLVKNIKGLGYKEASHFLRNIGYTDVSILDRHILNLMKEASLIDSVPKSLNRKIYLEIEQKFLGLANGLKMSASELDLYMWYLKTGKVLK